MHRIVSHLKISLSCQINFSLFPRKSHRETKFRHRIQPHFTPVRQSQLIKSSHRDSHGVIHDLFPLHFRRRIIQPGHGIISNPHLVQTLYCYILSIQNDPFSSTQNQLSFSTRHVSFRFCQYTSIIQIPPFGHRTSHK